MMKTLFIIFAMIALCAAQPAYAANGNQDDPCRDHSQIAINACAYQQYKAEDAKLNKTYKTLLSKSACDDCEAGDNPTQDLIAAEKSWISYRDNECKFEVRPGGSGYDALLNSCLEQLTIERNKLLNHLLSCDGADCF